MRMFKVAAEGKLCMALFSAFCTTLLLGTTIAAQPAEARSIKYNLDIPSQNLNDALQALALASQHKLLYSSELVDGKKSPALKGQFTTEQAIKALLADTNLSYEVTSDGLVLIRAADEPPRTSTAPAATGVDPTGESSAAKEAGKRSSQDSRLAQVDQGKVASEASVEKYDEQPSDKKLAELDGVVVTGSHIRGAPLSSPVIEIAQADIKRSGYASVGDVIRSLPQNFSGGNNPQNIGSSPLVNDNSDNAGTSPNLRGLGSGSTLTLVNGHRLADDTTDGGVDVSFIPVAAVERIDVLTDGASAAYGADAVGGVVNFILKRDFNGAQTSALLGNSTDGGAHQIQFNQLLGKAWQSGGAILAYTYDREDPVYASKRDFARLAAQPLSLLPGSELRSFFLSAHQEISSYASAFVEGLYGTRSSSSVSTFPASNNTVGYGNNSVEQYDVTAGITLKLPGDWRLNTVGSSAVNLAFSTFTAQTPTDEGGRTSSVEENAEGSLFALPAGDVRLALGVGYRHEIFNYSFPGYQAGGTRNVRYAYGELAVPIISANQHLWLHRLDLNLSGRDDDYSDTGRKSVPKIGLVLSPTSELTLRASWGKSFRAPPLSDKYGPVELLELAGFPNPSSATGTSQVLIPSGSNPSLKPESAVSKTLGFDYMPARLPSLKVSGSYYELAYTNRITALPNLFGALESDTFASFVTRNPSLALQQSLISAAAASGGVYNYTGGPFDPTQTAAIVNYTYVNVARQDLRGVDLLLNYKVSLSVQTLEVFGNGTYLSFRETLSPFSPRMTLSGTAFYPPKIKMRGGATWGYGPIATTGVVNYMGSEVNTFAMGQPHVSSWTTVDLHVAYSPTWAGWLSGFNASLSVRNLFNKDPPYVQYLGSNFPGANYDSNNASPLGRFVSLQLGKKW